MKPLSMTTRASERPMICSAVMGHYSRTSTGGRAFLFTVDFDMKPVQRAVHGRARMTPTLVGNATPLNKRSNPAKIFRPVV